MARSDSIAPTLGAASALLVASLFVPAAEAASDGQRDLRHMRGELRDHGPAVGNLWIVEFTEAPLAAYKGDVEGLAPTNPRARGERKLDSRSPASRAYLDWLGDRQADHLRAMSSALSRQVDPVFRYVAAANGVAVAMTGAEAERVRQMHGVARVTRDFVRPLNTDRGPLWIHADDVWFPTAHTEGFGTRGEDQVVGIIDSGVNADHDSFAETSDDGFTHTNPFGSGNFIGWCDPSHPIGFGGCNDKLIGAWDYTDAYCAANPATCSETDGPEDDNGHGSHTASTAAGNFIDSTGNSQRDLSGVAYHANLITYDACYTDPVTGQGLCPFSATSAGADQAVLDGVDAINYSISGGNSPWAGDIDTFFLNLVAAGTYVAAAAGNDGPGAATLSHLGPWVSTTAASTHDRVTVENELVDMTGGISPPADITGASRTGGYGPETIVYAGDFSNGDANPEQCLNPFPGGTWTSGEIVLCDRGTIARVLKCAHVAAGGAGGCILANVPGSTAIVADAHVIPAIHVDLTGGDALRAWLATGGGHTGEITDSTLIVDPAVGDVTADFSSRGPNESFSTLKPDVTAPGVNIIAAVNSDGVLPPPEFGLLSGTSMSSPHNAGAGALVGRVNGTWTPAEIKSALMLNAEPGGVTKEDGTTPADPFDMGSGRLHVLNAALSTLVLDETEENFLDANASEGGDPSTLNLASLQQNACVDTCVFTRTVRNPRLSFLEYTVSVPVQVEGGGIGLIANPNFFNLPSGETQEITFTVDASSLALGEWGFGAYTIATDLEGIFPDMHIPVAVRRATSNLPALLSIQAEDANGQRTVENLQTLVEITDAQVTPFGLVRGTDAQLTLDEDPTNGDPYDDLGQVAVKTVNVPAGARRLVVTTRSMEAPDVDLFVGSGAIPSLATELCSSTTATADEYCEITGPAAGTHWILVQNWQGSADQPDRIVRIDAVVDDTDEGNIGYSITDSIPAGTPFELLLEWDLEDFSDGGTWFGGVDLGSSPGNPDDVGTIAIDIHEPLPFFADGFESGDTSAWDNTVGAN